MIIIFYSFIIIYKYSFSKSKKQNMKKEDINIALCTLGKKENLYIKEFSDHYKNYGVNKIYLYDNNDIDGEIFEDEINDYINDLLK